MKNSVFTDEEISTQLDAVASHPLKAEKLSWKRKEKKMHGIIDSLSEIDAQILELYRQKQPHMDEIATLREVMVRDCIHQKSDLLHLGTYLTCKFCERNLSLPRITFIYNTDDDVGDEASDE